MLLDETTRTAVARPASIIAYVVKPKVPSGLVALSTAAVLTVYTAGFLKTRAAAAKIAQMDDRPAYAPPVATALAVPAPPTTPAGHATPAIPAVPRDRPSKPAPLKRAKVRPESVPTRPDATVGVAVTPPETTAPPTVATPPPPPPAPVPPPASLYKDGSYTGWGTSRHGDIEATVVIENGKIASARISQCLTRYSCSVIARIIPQVAERQSPDVDYVSGATQSANAFYYAVVEALGKAKQL